MWLREGIASQGVWVYQLTDKGLALEITAKSTKFSKDRLEVCSLGRRRSIAPPGQEGWPRHQGDIAKLPLEGAGGVVVHFN